MELEDVGTRYEHYRELLDLWEDGCIILNIKADDSWGLTKIELMQGIKSLEYAIFLLKKQLDILSKIESNMFIIEHEVDSVQKKLMENIDVTNEKGD